MSNNVAFGIEVSKETIANLLCSAVEAGRTYGCGYWAIVDEDTSTMPPVLASDNVGRECALAEAGIFKEYDYFYIHWALHEGGELSVIEHDDEAKHPEPVTHKITPDSIRKGLEVMSKEYPHLFGRVLADDVDGPLGEEFMQCCVFGTLKYG